MNKHYRVPMKGGGSMETWSAEEDMEDDKKHSIKQVSKRDMALDKKRGVKDIKKPKRG